MEDIILAKSFLLDNQLNFVVVKNGEVLTSSGGRGIKPIFDTYKENKEILKDASVADRVIGKAAAYFLIDGGIVHLYTDIISQEAYDLFIKNDIEVDFKTKVPRILNRTGDDLCPMEKISEKSKDLGELTKGIEEFFKNMK